MPKKYEVLRMRFGRGSKAALKAAASQSRQATVSDYLRALIARDMLRRGDQDGARLVREDMKAS